MKKFINIFFVIILCVVSLMPTRSILAKNEEVSQFSSTSYILLDAKSGEILTGFNEHEHLPVASICKLMTSLITLEEISLGNISLEDEFLASEYACSAEGSQAFLDAGSKYKVKDLLKSVLVASANDSAIALAENIAGSENLFVERMNNRAKELNMTDTIYQNSTGLNTIDNQHSSAYDTAIILKEVEKYEIYNEFSKIWMDTLVHPSGRETELVNTNRLIKYYDYCLGGKTGYTDEAGYCLSSMAKKDNLTLIAVVLNCKDSASRFKESMDLYNYGFANFENAKLISKDQILDCKIRIVGGKESETALHALEDYYALSKKGSEGNYTIEYEIDNNIKAPAEANAKVGTCIISKNGVVVKEIPVGIYEKAEKQTFKDVIEKIVDNWAL